MFADAGSGLVEQSATMFHVYRDAVPVAVQVEPFPASYDERQRSLTQQAALWLRQDPPSLWLLLKE